MLMIMYYYVKVRAIVNNTFGGSYTIYKYESPIKTTYMTTTFNIPEELRNEILDWAVDKFNEVDIKFERIAIETCVHSYAGIDWMEDNGEKISEDMDRIRELSKKEVEEYSESIKGQKDYTLNWLIPRIIEDIKKCRNLAEELNILDTQGYLNFLDTLNELSLDQDRPDTIKGKE